MIGVLTGNIARNRWIVLSPHLDDAVLSCGGLIAAVRDQASVEIWTMFSGAPYLGPYSPAARWLHGVSGGSTGSRLASKRRREDRAAGRLLGARCRHFGWHDAVYRKASDKSFLYTETRRDVWHPDDAWLIRDLSEKLRELLQEGDVLLAPLGIGGHVDHLIVRSAAEVLAHAPTLFYPDLPYAHSHSTELRSRVKSLRRVGYEIGGNDLRDWIAAVQCYASQLPMLEETAGTLSDLIELRADRGGLELYAEAHTVPATDIWSAPND